MPRLVSNSILDLDVAVVGRWLAETWAWWKGELRALVPERLRRARAAGTIAWLTPEDGLRFTRDGQAEPPERVAGGGATIAVGESQCLLRTLAMPATLGDADVKRAVRLDLERLMPFPEASALTEISVGPAAGDERPVTIAALPLATAEAALDAAVRARFEPTALALLDADGAIRFDFLPRLRALRGEPDIRAERRFWWRLAIGLLVLNMLVLVIKDIRSVHTLGELVEAHGQLADQVRLKRRRLLSEQTQRQLLAERRSRSDPLAIIADLSARVPPGAWLKRLELERGRGRIVGVRSAAADVMGALRRDPRLRGVHASSVDALAATPEGQPFDISFGLR